MTEIVSYVDAIFDGKQVRMQIDRDKFPAFESIVRQPIYQTFNKFAEGLWTSTDLAATLAFALTDFNSPTNRQQKAMLGLYRNAQARSLVDHLPVLPLPKESIAKVNNLLIRRPPGPYALLALKILQAALFGLPAALANFDENQSAEVETNAAD